MPAKRIWTEAEDAAISRMRGERVTWDAIAAAVGGTRWSVIEHAKLIGAWEPERHEPPPEDDDLDRDPYPASHPATWG